MLELVELISAAARSAFDVRIVDVYFRHILIPQTLEDGLIVVSRVTAADANLFHSQARGERF